MTSYPCNKCEQITPSYLLSVNYNTLHKLNLNFNQNLLVLSFYLRIILIIRTVKNGDWINRHSVSYNFTTLLQV